MNTLLIQRVCIVGCLFSCATMLQKQVQAVELHQLRVAEDETKTASERLKVLLKLLAEEMREPTALKDSSIQNHHDWVLVNLAGVMGSLAERDEELKNSLRQKLDKEPNQDTRRVLCIALAVAGDPSVWKDLKEIIRLDNRPWLQEYAVSATMESKSVLLAPDLIELLNHPRHHKVQDRIEYPLRRRAFLALREMGVQIEMQEPESKGEFKFDRGSAVRVVATKLGSKDKDEVFAAIEAIGRVGGDEAVNQLTIFVDANQKRLQKAAEVGFAQATIESIKKNRKPKQ